MSTGPRVAILGAGPSGLAACKAAVEEGLHPTVFEAGPGVGGVWRQDEHGKVWTSMRTNLSKYTCVFSDTPWPDEAPDFPGGAEVQEYLEKYSDRHGVSQHVRCRCRVVSVAPGPPGGAGQGTWRVSWERSPAEPGGSPETFAEEFDFVVVATGIFSKPGIPDLPGVGSFRGTSTHASEYRDGKPFEGQRVLVVGAAFSGADIAADLARSSPPPASVTVASRRPLWYLPRNLGGKPCDLAFYTRAGADRNAGVSEETRNRNKHAYFSTVVGELPGTLPCPDPEKDPPYVAITDHFLESVKSGSVGVRASDVVRIHEHSAEFSDGHCQDFDAIVWATGYRLDLPFFGEEALEALEFDASDMLQPTVLDSCVWRPELPGIAFVGMYRGPYFGAMELQARWACGVFSGRLRPPSPEESAANLDEERRIRAMRPRPQFPHGDYVSMMEDLARKVDVHPADLYADDSQPLQKLLYDGPLLPFHYRLVGFGADRDMAERAIRACAARLVTDP